MKGYVTLSFWGNHFLVAIRHFFLLCFFFYILLLHLLELYIEFTKLNVAVVRTLVWKSGDPSSRLRYDSVHSMILDW